MEIRAVLFDLGGTLVDTRDFSGWADASRQVGLDVDADALARAHLRLYGAEQPPRITFRERWAAVLSDATERAVPNGVVDRFLQVLRSRPIGGSLFSDVRRCLDRLQRERRRLGIVSNSRSESAVRELLGRLRVLPAFELVVSSGTENVEKPDPEIFRRAVGRLGLEPGSVLFLGDDVENDARGAVRAGLHAVWLNRSGTGLGVDPPEITSLSEVPRVVRDLELAPSPN